MSIKLNAIVIFIFIVAILIPGCSVLSENKYQKGDLLQSESTALNDNCAMYVVDYYPNTEIYRIGFVVAKGDQWYRIGIAAEQDVPKNTIEDPYVYKIGHADGVLPIDNTLSFIASTGVFDSNAKSNPKPKSDPTTFETYMSNIKKFIFDEPEFQEGDIISCSEYNYYRITDYDKTNKSYLTQHIKYNSKDGVWYVKDIWDNHQNYYSQSYIEENYELVDHIDSEYQIKIYSTTDTPTPRPTQTKEPSDEPKFVMGDIIGYSDSTSDSTFYRVLGSDKTKKLYYTRPMYYNSLEKEWHAKDEDRQENLRQEYTDKNFIRFAHTYESSDRNHL